MNVYVICCDIPVCLRYLHPLHRLTGIKDIISAPQYNTIQKEVDNTALSPRSPVIVNLKPDSPHGIYYSICQRNDSRSECERTGYKICRPCLL
jgi:hypothetical protein